MNVTNIPKSRYGKVGAALEILKSVGVPQKHISMVAGGFIKREEARRKRQNRRRARTRKGKR